jgi:hypothetical protein
MSALPRLSIRHGAFEIGPIPNSDDRVADVCRNRRECRSLQTDV